MSQETTEAQAAQQAEPKPRRAKERLPSAIPEDPNQVMTLAQVAACLGITVQKARAQLARGLACIELGEGRDDIRVLAGDLLDYMERMKKGAVRKPASYRMPGFADKLEEVKAMSQAEAVRQSRRERRAGLSPKRGRTAS